MTNPGPIRHLLLDIEGTTCPVNFVSEVLFPYARANLLPFLTRHQSEAPIQTLLLEVQALLEQDPNPVAMALRSEGQATNQERFDPPKRYGLDTLCSYLDWLIQTDRKVTPLKDLQGRIWDEGYQRGDLIAPLFPEVPSALRRWHDKGLGLAVYSSGSVHAQQLLYGHTKHGDLTHLFSHWFDTRTGPKNDPTSYQTIATILHAEPQQILFISDATSELTAASEAGMAVLFSLRPGNPQQDPQHFSSIETFDQVER